MSRIPNFWPLVIEQAPPDIDEYIQPSDSAILLGSLTGLSVHHFEAETEPRSVAITFTFAANDVFEDASLTKRFWHRRAADGWAGLVSEPVDIRWRKGKDLTRGLLGLVKRVWDEDCAAAAAAAAAAAEKGDSSSKMKKKKRKTAVSAERAALKKRIESTGLGGLSFFAWFGFVGRRVSAEESRLATEKERERRRLRREGAEVPDEEEDEGDEDEDEDEEEEDDDESLEIFPTGDDLAIAIAEDLWPGAIKYFSMFFFIPSSNPPKLRLSSGEEELIPLFGTQHRHRSRMP